jgi:hypothetical protein
MSAKKPELAIIGKDGNAFAILAAAGRAARRAGWTQEQKNKMMSEATSGNYAHLLQVLHQYFEVC